MEAFHPTITYLKEIIVIPYMWWYHFDEISMPKRLTSVLWATDMRAKNGPGHLVVCGGHETCGVTILSRNTMHKKSLSANEISDLFADFPTLPLCWARVYFGFLYWYPFWPFGYCIFLYLFGSGANGFNLLLTTTISISKYSSFPFRKLFIRLWYCFWS